MIPFCMTMLSFRVPDDDAAEVQRWAEALGVDRSEILRDALHRHLVALGGEHDALAWERMPLDSGERSLSEVADWGPAEDWADWNMQRGEIWFAATPAAIARCSFSPATRLRIASARSSSPPHADPAWARFGVVLSAAEDGVPSDCVVNFDNLHAPARHLPAARHRSLAEAHGAGLSHLAQRNRLLISRRRLVRASSSRRARCKSEARSLRPRSASRALRRSVGVTCADPSGHRSITVRPGRSEALLQSSVARALRDPRGLAPVDPGASGRSDSGSGSRTPIARRSGPPTGSRSTRRSPAPTTGSTVVVSADRRTVRADVHRR